MKKSLLISFFLIASLIAIAQQPAGNTQGATIRPPAENTGNAVANQSSNPDSVIKARLVDLAIKNAGLSASDASIKIAQYTLDKAKSSWLASLNASGNINEFVVNGAKDANGVPVASYFPKYNLGISIPFDVFSRTKYDSKIASQDIVIARAAKEDKIRGIKANVLTLYENYKEQKELLRLQQISTEEDNEAYVGAQKNYADGSILLQELNKTYQEYIYSQSKLAINQRDYNVAVVQLEQVIGVPLSDALTINN